MARLKVYVTPTGFHDAYVAAPSQKAALQAWGSDHDLFARGIASIVEDPALTEEPLAHPGKVIKRLRGSAAEQIAAAEADARPRNRRKAATRKGSGKVAAARPLPDRSTLDAADAALAEAEARHKRESDALEEQIAQLRAVLSKLRDDQESELRTLRTERDAADEAYRRVLERYRDG